jgi:hypothetical protein
MPARARLFFFRDPAVVALPSPSPSSPLADGVDAAVPSWGSNGRPLDKIVPGTVPLATAGLLGEFCEFKGWSLGWYGA